MNAQSATFSFGQDLEITAGLRRLDDAEGVLLLGNRELYSVVTRDLKKDSAVGAAFVCLSGGVKKARSETKAGSDAFLIADLVADRLQAVFVCLVHLDVGEQREVIAGAKLAEMRTQKAFE